MKFGKYLESKQLELPEYLGYFINYKALKKLIKQLATIHSPHPGANSEVDFASHNIEKLLQDNKSTFFFRVERELEKVNEFYIEKQADLKLKLDILVNKKLQLLKYNSLSANKHNSSSSWDKNSSITFQTLYANFKQFTNKLDQLSQFVELNETGFRKILKKWDKRSKSHLKEIYLSTTVNVQPVFHREEINHLNDLVANSILELEAYADGENVVAFSKNFNINDDNNTNNDLDNDNNRLNIIDDDRQTDELYSKFLNIATAPHNQLILLSNWLNKLKDFKSADKLTKVFFLALSAAIEDIYLINFYNYFKQYIDLKFVDYYTNKNFLHQIASTNFRKFQTISNQRNKDTRSSSIIKLQRLDETQISNNLIANDDKDNNNDNKDSSQINNAIAEENSFSRFFLIKTLLVDDTTDEFSQLLTIKDNNSKTPLHYAAEFGRYDLLKLLVDKNPQNLHTLDNRTMTPLLLAIKHNHLNCVKYLLSKENEIANQKSQSSESFKAPNSLAAADITPGFSPLNYACKYGNYEIIKTLLDYSNIIDKTAQNVEGLLPLHMAARSGHFKVIELLVTYGKLNPNCLCSLHNWTPIFYAAVHGHSRTTRELIKYGAVPDIVDEKNYTPIYYAAYSGHVNVLNTLFHSINFANSNVPLTIKNLSKKDKNSINSSSTNNNSVFGNFSNFNNNTPNINSLSSVNINSNQNSTTSTPTNISSMFKTISKKISSDTGLNSQQHHFSPSQDTSNNHNNNNSNTNNNNNNSNNNSINNNNNNNGVSASVSVPSTESNLLNSTTEHLADNINLDAIPTLSLPPPIIPLRKYGHNFLEKKTSLQISFLPGKSSIKLFNYHNNNSKHARAVARGTASGSTIFNTNTFSSHTTYNDSHRDIQKVDFDNSDYGQTLDESDTPLFPGRITITSSNSDVVPRNLLLPIDEKDNFVNFQIDELTKDFSMEYELFPTFGTKLIAKTTALANVFLNNGGGGNGNNGNFFLNDDSGIVTLPLFDTRLKNIGSLTFKFQIIYSYCGAPLEITKYETYWKSTNNDQQESATNAISDSENNINNSHNYAGSSGGSLTDSSSKFTSMLSFVAASSLSGDYLKINICMLNDGTPIICPRSFIELDGCGIKLSLLNLSSSELFAITSTHTQLGDIEKKFHDLSKDYHCMINALANSGDGGGSIFSHGDNSGIGSSQEQLNLVKKNFLKRASELLSNLYLPLDLLLQYLPKEISVNFDIFYPTKFELKHFFKVLSVNNDTNNTYTSVNNVANGISLNNFIDRILSLVFNHIRSSNQQGNYNVGDNTITNSANTNSDNKKRSIVFSSYNPIVCKVLNWKQPNFPVFFTMGGTRFNYSKNNFELNSANGFTLTGSGSGLVADAAISSPSAVAATASGIDDHNNNNNNNNDNSHNNNALDFNRADINIGNPKNTFDDANDSEYYNTIKQNDEESCTRSIEAAIRFATVNNLIGIIVPIKLLLLVPDLSKTIRSRGLILVGSKEDPKKFNNHFMRGAPSGGSGSARAAIPDGDTATVDAGVSIDNDIDVEGQQRQSTVGAISNTIKDFEDIEIKDYSKTTSINGVRINNLLEFQGSIDM